MQVDLHVCMKRCSPIKLQLVLFALCTEGCSTQYNVTPYNYEIAKYCLGLMINRYTIILLIERQNYYIYLLHCCWRAGRLINEFLMP